MTQAHDDVPTGAETNDPQVGAPIAALRGPFRGWLVLANPDGPIDLERIFPEVEVRVERTSAGMADALALAAPTLIVLMAPPAGPVDLQRVASWLDANPASCAVLMSPHQAVALRLHALELGFNDAVDLSADPMELIGRLSIAGRRGPVSLGLPDDRIAIDDGVELDRRARAIRRDGHLMSLRPKELALLDFLATHPGRAFSREELMRRVWHEAAGNERTVDVYVFWLRSKIERDAANPVRLLTVRGSGYLFEPPFEPRRPSPAAERAGEGRPANVNKGPTQR
jgi:DNA-binding response OmpR family regulator